MREILAVSPIVPGNHCNPRWEASAIAHFSITYLYLLPDGGLMND